MTNYVKQEHQSGCMVAVLAMIFNITYQEALEYFPTSPDDSGGYHSFLLDTILADQGYAVARKYKHRTGFGYDRHIWPAKPFAKIHWCEVVTTKGQHAVVMLEDGTVLDPWSELRHSLDCKDYIKVNFVAAVTRFE